MVQKSLKSQIVFCAAVGLNIVFQTSILIGKRHEGKNRYSYIELVENKEKTYKSDSYYKFLKATYLHYTGKLDQSFEIFQQILIKKHSDFIYEALLQLLFDRCDFAMIATLTEKKQKEFDILFKNNLSARLIIAQSFLNIGQEEKAEQLFQTLIKEYPNDEQIAYHIAIFYIKKNNFNEALEFLNTKIENPAMSSKHFLFYFLKSKVYMLVNQPKQALNSVEKSLSLFPKFDRGQLLKAALLEQLGYVNEAIKGYEGFLNIVGRDIAIEKQLVHLLFSQQQFDKAAIYLKKMKGNSSEYYFDLALIELSAKKFTQALENINKAIEIKKDKEFDQARILKVEILIALSDISKALSFMQQWIFEKPDSSTALQTLMLLRKEYASTQDIIEILEKLSSTDKQNSIIFSALADLYLEKKQYEKSLFYYQKIVSVTINTAIKSKTLFQIGYVQFLKNDFKQMEITLKDAMKYHPTYPSVYNLLAYHYAQQNYNLEEALQFIDKAITSHPGCHCYLDTKGCILLKLGRKEEAINFFEQALKKSPQDATILEHLKKAHEHKK
jgi:tetratricopeptide (TPR) repeat protein